MRNLCYLYKKRIRLYKSCRTTTVISASENETERESENETERESENETERERSGRKL